MTFADERLVVHLGRARARFVEDATLALKEAKPSKTDLDETLQEQLGHGRRLLEMAEAGCYLASVARLQPHTRADMEWALTVGVKAFQDLQETVADWTRQHGVAIKGMQDLGPLVTQLDQCRAELASGLRDRHGDAAANQAVLPQVGTVEWGQMNRRRAELIRKNIHGELSADEREEYETLQRSSLAAVEASFSRQSAATSSDGNPEASGE